MNHSLKVPWRSSNALRVATYNVRSLPPAKQLQLAAGCEKYYIDVTVFQEHRQQFEDDLDYNRVDEGLFVRISASSRGTGGICVFVSNKLCETAEFTLTSRVEPRLDWSKLESSATQQAFDRELQLNIKQEASD